MTYQFPTLPIEDCLKHLKNYDVRIEDHDFRKPDPSRWQNIYCQLLELMAGVPVESIKQKAQLQSMDYFEFAELQEESLPLITLTLSLQRFLCACGVTDFTINDLFNPKTNRLVKLCSAIINYVLFKDSRMNVFLELKSQNERFREQHDYLLQQNNQLKRKINSIKAEKAEKEPEIQAAQQEVDELKMKLESSYEGKTQMLQRINEMKALIAEKKAHLDQVRVLVAQSSAEREMLSKKIIQSPERVKAEDLKARENLEILKNTLETKRQLLMERQQQVDSIKEVVVNNVDKAFKMLKEIQVDIEKENEISKEIHNLKDKGQEQKDLVRDLGAKRDTLKHQVQARQEKMSKLGCVHQQKLRLNEETVRQHIEEKSLYTKKNSDDEKKKTSTLQEKQRLIQEVKKEEAQLSEQIDVVQMTYHEIVQSLEKFHVDLGQGWDQVRRTLADKD